MNSFIKPWYYNPKYGDCNRCGAFLVTLATHQCTPTWRVFDADYCEEEDAKEVCARDAKDAAIKYADRFDSDHHEYGILQHGITVTVIGPDGARTRFNLTGESVPSYWAEEVTDD
jgi:hypothetical protein